MKEKLFKILFPGKFELLEAYEKDFNVRVAELEKKAKERPSMADLMRDSIGLPMIDFSNVNEYGRPPSYMSGLGEVERKNYIASLVAIYRDPKFQAVYNYVNNVLGNHTVQVFDDDKMKTGRYAIIGVKAFMKEFEKAISEHTTGVKSDEEWDPLAPIPE